MVRSDVRGIEEAQDNSRHGDAMVSMQRDSRIYVAGHRGLVGSAICRSLAAVHNIIMGRTHAELDLLDPVAVKRFFDEERPEYVFLAAACPGDYGE